MYVIKEGFSFVILVLTVSLFFVGFGSAALQDGLVGYWSFDSDVNADYGPFTIESSNLVSISTGHLGSGASEYNGGSSYLTISDGLIPSGSNPSTVAFWVYPDTVSGYHTIYDGGNYYNANKNAITQTSSGFFFGGGSPSISSGIFSANSWSYVVVTYDGSSLKIYVDGNTPDSTATTTLNIGTDNTVLGGWGNNNAIRTAYQWFFDGKIDEFGVWNRSLTTDEISQLYNSGTGFAYPFAPAVTISSPTNATYYNYTNITINFTADDFDMLWYKNDSSATSSITFTDGVAQYFNASDGQYNFTFYANNSGGALTTEQVTFWIDTINPEIEYVDDADGLVGTPLNNSNFSRDWIFVNFSINETNLDNYIIQVYYENGTLVTDYDDSGPALTYNNFTGLSDGVYFYNITIYDLAGRINFTETRKITLDTTAPTYSSLVYSPSINASIDPNETIYFNITVVDSDSELPVDSVYLYYNLTYWNGTEVTETPLEMVNNSGIYSINFTTFLENATYRFYIGMNDTVNNTNYTLVYTFYSFWDCTWSLTTTGSGYDLQATGGYNEFRVLNNFTIFNTGDVEYHINNCSINFAKDQEGSNWPEGNVYLENLELGFSQLYYLSDFTGVSNSRGLRYIFNDSQVRSLVVNASENKTIQVKGYFPLLDDSVESLTENPYFVVASSINDTETGLGNITLNAEMTISSGAYLKNEIETPSQNEILIPLEIGNTSFKAYVKNLASYSSLGENATAYNVSFNWTLPSEISSLFVYDNLSFFNETVNDTDKRYLNLTLVLDSSNLESLTQTNYTLYTSAYGYENSTGNLSLINHTSGENILSDSVSIRFYCSDTTSSSPSAACRPAVVSTSSGRSGGSGGGGGGGSVERSEASYEIVRGEENSFVLEIKNKLSSPKQNINISTKGINSEYIKLIPSSIDYLEGSSSKNVTVEITAPGYFTQSKYELEFKISGEIKGNTTSQFTENRYVTLYIVEISTETAKEMLANSSRYIEEMNSSNFKTKEVLKLQEQMQNAFDEYDYLTLRETFNSLKEIYEASYEAEKLIKELQELVEKAEYDGIKVTDTKRALYTAEAIFERGDYVLALERLQQAKNVYAFETKGELNVIALIKNNPLESLGIFFIIITVGFAGNVALKFRIYKSRLKTLNEEEKLLLQLMKVIQVECFQNKKMSMEEYQEAMNQYEKRLSETIQEKISTETKLANLMKLKGKKIALEQEKKKLILMMKDLQNQYLNKGTLETRVYENMIKNYSSRLSKVDEQIVFLEAKEAMKRK